MVVSQGCFWSGGPLVWLEVGIAMFQALLDPLPLVHRHCEIHLGESVFSDAPEETFD